jgi:putative resolvase
MATANSICTPQASQTGLLSISEAAKFCGLHVNTLRKYSNSGRLATYRTPGGNRRYAKSDLAELMGGSDYKEENYDGGQTKVIIYARISDGRRSKGFAKGEQSDLARQVDRLKEYAIEHYGEDAEIETYAETASGLSFNRKMLNKLIDGMLSGQIRDSILLCTHPERLARIAREILLRVCDWANVKIIYTERDENLDAESSPGELIAEFCSSVISRIYSKRSSERSKKQLSPHVVNRIVELRQSGVPYSKIQTILNSEGLRCDDGAAVGIAVIQRYLKESVQLEVKKERSIETYFAENVVVGAGNLRLKKEDLWADYAEWCKAKCINPITPHHVGRILKIMGLETAVITDPLTGTKLVWKSVYIRAKSNLSVIVKEKPQKPAKALESQSDNSFVVFYDSHLKGKFRGYSRDLWESYKAFCKQQNCRPISFRLVPKLILDLSGQTSQKFGAGGLLYDLRGQSKGVLGSVLPRLVLRCAVPSSALFFENLYSRAVPTRNEIARTLQKFARSRYRYELRAEGLLLLGTLRCFRSIPEEKPRRREFCSEGSFP